MCDTPKNWNIYLFIEHILDHIIYKSKERVENPSVRTMQKPI